MAASSGVHVAHPVKKELRQVTLNHFQQSSWNFSEWFDGLILYIELLRGFTPVPERTKKIKIELSKRQLTSKDVIAIEAHLKNTKFSVAKLKIGLEITDFILTTFTLTQAEIQKIYHAGMNAGMEKEAERNLQSQKRIEPTELEKELLAERIKARDAKIELRECTTQNEALQKTLALREDRIERLLIELQSARANQKREVILQ